MKLSNGVDIIRIARLEAATERQGEPFLARFLTPGELERCRKADGTFRLNSVAALYAAKEAFSKALSTGIADGVRLIDIEVVKDAKGAPYYSLHGTAKARFLEAGFTSSALSLSHEGEYAVAFCTLYG